MQIAKFEEPLSEALIDRCLEAYLLWLFGKVMFTQNHVNTVDARYIAMARQIADAREQLHITQRGYGYALLAAMYRGLCSICTKNSKRSALIGCPLLLQLWSYERLPIGRPSVCVDHPFKDADLHIYMTDIGDLPTVGAVWTRREVLLS